MKYLFVTFALFSVNLQAYVLCDEHETLDNFQQKVVKFCLLEYLKIEKSIENFARLYPKNEDLASLKVGEIREGIFADIDDDVRDELQAAYNELPTELIFHDNFTCFCTGKHFALMKNVLEYILSSRATQHHKWAVSRVFLGIFVQSVPSCDEISARELAEIPEGLHSAQDELSAIIQLCLTQLKQSTDLYPVRQVARKCGEAALKFLAPLPEMR